VTRRSPLLAHFTPLDWGVLAAYLLLTTLLGVCLAGRPATIREFFLGGRRLPWYAVSGSIIATEISAVTFISAPAIVYAAGGDLTYLQLTLGALLARVIIGLWFVPAFYEREIYSPYDYVGDRLGAPARTATTLLFMLGAVLGQSVRVLLTALILQEITGLPLPVSIWIIGLVAVIWTLLGGITTVIWTDVIQFCVFVGALAAALVFIDLRVPGGWAGVIAAAASATDESGQPASKLRLWNLSFDPNVAFTLWAALIGNTLLCLNAYGTDQMIAQRMFCCRGPRQASLAILSSSVGLLVAVLAMMVGLGLYAFYQHQPLDAASAARVAERVDRIFPIFIVRELPAGLTGLIIAGVFAAAISSLDSVLAALAQVVITGLYRPWRAQRSKSEVRSQNSQVRARAHGSGSEALPSPADGAPSADQQDVLLSRLLVVVWAVVLCAMAHVADAARQRYGDILNLALAMATYTGGATLAAFLLALLRPNVDHRGVVWGAPLSVLTVFAISWHQSWAQLMTIVLAGTIVAAWIGVRLGEARRRMNSLRRAAWRAEAANTVWLILAAAAAVFLSAFRFQVTGPAGTAEWRHITVAWPWNVPIGLTVALTLGYLLARPRPG
jgi:SSS family transporter